MICLAVVAAIRPKPLGLSSYSPTFSPSSSSSVAKTVTCPVLRSSSTRACSMAPGVLWYAVRRDCSMASIRTSKEISFSRSSVRRMLRSMSMASCLLGCASVELDLDQRLGHRVVLQPLRRAQYVESGAGIVTVDDAAGDLAAVAKRDLDQAGAVAAPVTRLGQRPVDAAGRHLQRVGVLPHQLAVVEMTGHRLGGVGDVVEADPAVLVDGDAQPALPAGGSELDRLEVQAQVGQRVAERIGDPRAVRAERAHDADLLCCCRNS